MANLEAELARFEAELAGTNGAQQHLPGPPGPSYHPVPSTLPPPPPFHGSGGANISSSLQAPQASLRPPPSQLPPPPQQAAPAYAAPGAAHLPPPPAAYAAQPYVSQAPQQSYALPRPIAQQPMPSNYYAAPQYPQYTPATSGAAPVYASAAGSVGGGAHSQHDVAGVKAALEREANEKKKKPPAMPRAAGGQKWWDPTLTEWPENDFRIFVGDLGNEVNDDVLTKAFQKFNSFAKAKVVRNKHTNKTKGFGFVSFTDTVEGAKALREMDGKYIGNRPCKLRKSTWDERTNTQALQKKRKGGHDGKPVLNMKKHVGVLHR